MKLGRLLVSSVILAATSLANSQPALPTAERPELKPGDSWTFKQIVRSDGDKLTSFNYEVQSLDAAIVKLAYLDLGEQTTQEHQYSTDLNFITNGTNTDTPSSIRFAFPLTQGKVIDVDYRYTSGERSGRVDGKCTVAAFERVKTPAGDFDAYKVECKFSQNASRPGPWYGRYTETIWYAPAARFWVRLEREVRGAGYWSSITRELTALSLK